MPPLQGSGFLRARTQGFTPLAINCRPVGAENQGERRGVVLLAVLVVVALLILVAYGFFGLMNAEYEAAHASNRVAGGRLLADSGLHYAAFVLGNPQLAGISDAEDSLLVSPIAIYDNAEAFHGVPISRLNPQTQGQGYFSIISPRDIEDPLYTDIGFRFGVEDESAKINLNALLRLDPTGEQVKQTLLKVPAFNMTPEQADSVLNWMRAERTGGQSANADSMHYSRMGYMQKNGLYESLEELLLVRGVTPRRLLGNDRNRNGILEPDEDDTGGILDPGWSRFMTIYSRERNVDAQGQPRIYVNDGNLSELYEKLTTALGEELANFIIGYRIYKQAGLKLLVSINGEGEAAQVEAVRGEVEVLAFRLQAQTQPNAPIGTLKREHIESALKKISQSGGGGQNIDSLYELIGSEFQMPASDAPDGQEVRFLSPLQKDKKDVLRQKLPILLDKLSTKQELELAPRINVNTAPREVLMALPELDESKVEDIFNNRPSPSTDPAQMSLYRTPAWLITEAGFEPSLVQQLDPFITTRSQVYRLQIVGYFQEGGPTVRLEAIVDANYGRPRILYWRDITELGKGFDLRLVPRPGL